MGGTDTFHGNLDDPRTFFDGNAATYASVRPGYPRAALDWILGGLGDVPRVVDLGTGPGIAARALAGRGADVIGIEPNADMLRVALEAPARPRLRFVRGQAEATGLASASVDAVVCSQSFHWFDPDRALPEICRILRPAGRVALMWNVHERGAAVSADYTALVRRARDAADRAGRAPPRGQAGRLVDGPWFRDARSRRFANAASYDRAGLIARAASASYFPAAGPLRKQLITALGALFERHAEDGRVTLERWCEVTIAGRVDVG